MARSTEQRFLENNLVFLEEQEQQLCSIIHEKIGEVLKTGRTWLSDGNEESTRCSFREMNQMIEDTVQFMSQISNEIQGDRQGSSPQGASVTSTMKTSSDSSSLQETKYNRPVVGFTASFSKVVKLTQGAIVTGYTRVKCNTDGSFDEKTGTFTAPVKGVYGVCLRLWQVGDESVALDAYKTSTQQSKDELVLSTRTVKDGNGDTAISVIDLDITDTICIKVYDISGNPGLDLLTEFSCFLIS